MSTKDDRKYNDPSPDSAVDLCSDSEEERAAEELSPVHKRLKTQVSVKVKTENVAILAPAHVVYELNDDNEIEIVEREDSPLQSTDGANLKNDEDVEMVGFKGDRLPHARCNCPDHRFVSISLLNDPMTKIDEGIAQNKITCDLCYCYVCDKPASDCKMWSPTERDPSPTTNNSHCLACDKGINAHLWKSKREVTKGQIQSIQGAFDNTLAISPFGRFLERTPEVRGPFAPDYKGNMTGLTQCRKCGWFSRLLFKRRSGIIATCSQWCHKCGRVASDHFLTPCCEPAPLSKNRKIDPIPWCPSTGPPQGTAYVKQALDVLVGIKHIPFTIHAHDPRKITAYKKSWEENSWEYDEAEMEEDAFRQRFGNFTLPTRILRCISLVESVPSNGRFRDTLDDEDYEDPEENLGWGSRLSRIVSISETEAIVLENSNHIALLEELSRFEDFGQPHQNISSAAPITGHIQPIWNRNQRKGVFTVTLYLRPHAQPTGSSCSLTYLLGAWYEVFPFSASSLINGILAVPSDFMLTDSSHPVVFECPPFNMTRAEEEKIREDMKDEIQEAIDQFNVAVACKRDELSFLSSSNETWLGGTTRSIAGSFSDCMQSFFSDMIVEEIYKSDAQAALRTWSAKPHGLRRNHRQMSKAACYRHTTMLRFDELRPRRKYYQTYLPVSEYALVQENIRPEVAKVVNRIKSHETLVQHLENLGHKAIDHVEGLNVELLEFQKQSVQWALERERQEGGIQSFFWTELPTVEDDKVENLYLNPILDRVSKTKPKLVRGGLICEEVGMGKTIISLALVLENPAPPLPESGSIVPDAFPSHHEAGLGWDPDMKASLLSSGSNSKRARILSRGTLVICHVSLVGQWCEEAKRRLIAPGMVYPYHGGCRKRDPKTLAANSIVVTTYATLASDVNYHGKGIDGHVSPCEQIRWWRIIVDESHTMKTTGTKQSQAVLNLVADHKWAVTGTPVNTSLSDISNQLRLIGIENVAEYFELFRETVFKIVKDSSFSTGNRRRRRSYDCRTNYELFGPFVFFMRTLMIRHSKKMKYLGTDTELMALPEKTERTIQVKLTDKERAEYSVLETEAREFYLSFKANKARDLSKYYLQLSSALQAQRYACSGGHIPLTEDTSEEKKDELEGDESDEELDQSEEEPEGKKKKKRKKTIVTYSEFVYTSKLKRLIEELSRIRDKEPDNKSLIFSNFSSTLIWLREELPKHGFQFRYITGQMPMRRRAEALRAFQNDPPTTVFLLSMRTSNCGINLTQANRVFLMEPSLNPAIVQQAIGRVHRLGQTREVEIIRMIIKDSIETRVTAMLAKKYGPSTSERDDGEDTKKPASEGVVEGAQVTPFVGSLVSEKVKVLTEEFDLLFGVPPSTDEEEDESEGAGKTTQDSDAMS